jgi:hypothetical protein
MRIVATVAAVLVLLPVAALADSWSPFKSATGTGTSVQGELKGGGRGGNGPGTLRAMCSDKSTIVEVAGDSFNFGSSDMVVRYKLDYGPLESATWEACERRHCVGLGGGQSIASLKTLFNKRQLRMVFELRDGDPIDATFNIAGAQDALAEVGQRCAWLPKPK